MKILNLFLILLISTSCKNKPEFIQTPTIVTEVDRLKSGAEIEEFVHKIDTNYRKYELKNLQDFNRSNSNDSLNKILANKHNVTTNFTKADFDNNGFTDLLLIGDNHNCTSFSANSKEESCSFTPIVVMNFGNNKTKIYRLDMEWGQAMVPKVEYINSRALLVIYQNKVKDWEKQLSQEFKTALTFKFGDFIEFNEDPKKIKISKIEFKTSGCFGTCPVYKLSLNRDSLSVFNAQYYNFNKNREIKYGKEEGVFTTTINKSEFDKLEELLNYCDFENLNDNYAVTHTDDQTGNLKITFNNGKVKTINDYGMIGTYGLNMLYTKLADLRFNLKWQKK